MLCLDFIIYISNIEFEFYWNLFSKYIFLILGMIEDGNQTENAEEKTWEGAYGYEFLTL